MILAAISFCNRSEENLGLIFNGKKYLVDGEETTFKAYDYLFQILNIDLQFQSGLGRRNHYQFVEQN